VKFLLRSLVHIYGIGDGIFITDIRTECHPRLVDKLSKTCHELKNATLLKKGHLLKLYLANQFAAETASYHEIVLYCHCADVHSGECSSSMALL
jgi:hypothetical protein